MGAHDIIKEYLKNNKYDGLYNSWIECACLVDDLVPCVEGICNDCKPGYKADCTPDCDHEFMDDGWHIQEEKPK